MGTFACITKRPRMAGQDVKQQRGVGGDRRIQAVLGLPALPAGELGFKMAEQRFLWSVLPCLMAWPTVAMPVPHAAGLQVRVQHHGCMC